MNWGWVVEAKVEGLGTVWAGVGINTSVAVCASTGNQVVVGVRLRIGVEPGIEWGILEGRSCVPRWRGRSCVKYRSYRYEEEGKEEEEKKTYFPHDHRCSGLLAVPPMKRVVLCADNGRSWRRVHQVEVVLGRTVSTIGKTTGRSMGVQLTFTPSECSLIAGPAGIFREKVPDRSQSIQTAAPLSNNGFVGGVDDR